MNAAVIFGIILFLLILGAAIVFLILWLNKRAPNSNKELAIEGVVFKLEDLTKLVATWTKVGSSSSEVTLYADTTVIDLDSSGKPDPAKNSNVLVSKTVSGNAKTISLSGLKPETTYFAKLVVTSSKVSGFNADEDTVFTGGVPEGNFLITEFHTAGAIESSGTPDQSNNVEISYNTKPNKENFADLWNYDRKEMTITQRGRGKDSNKTFALYDNNGVLTAKDLSILKQEDSTLKTAKWSYNSVGNNRWCLVSDPNLCMNLSTPASGGDRITIVRNAKSQWKNLPVFIT